MIKSNPIPSPDIAKLAVLKKWSVVISVIVLSLVGVMRRVKIDLGIDFTFLPMVNAICNTIVAICLVTAFYHIKSKNWQAHRRFIYAAMVFSALFLTTYVLYHITTIETTYCHGDGVMKMVYYFFLATHIILAGVSLPFILLTFSRGETFHVDAHKKMARWVFPIWLYVAISGPICYLILKDCY
jgi:putative membrane protein